MIDEEILKNIISKNLPPYFKYVQQKKEKHENLKILLFCEKHNEEFAQDIYRLKLGANPCKKCVKEKRAINTKNKYNQEWFLKKMKKIHGDKIDFSKSVYESDGKHVIATCSEHGDWLITPSNLTKGHACPSCSHKKTSIRKRSNRNEFIEKAVLKHGNKYDYSKVEYNKSNINVIIACLIHGDFLQTPNSHLMGRGCSVCANGRISEKEVKWLDSLNISTLIRQHRINISRKYNISKSYYIADGYDPVTNTIYEFDGNYYHGNPLIYENNDIINHVNNKQMSKLYEETLIRNKFYKNMGYNLVTIWENDWDKL